MVNNCKIIESNNSITLLPVIKEFSDFLLNKRNYNSLTNFLCYDENNYLFFDEKNTHTAVITAIIDLDIENGFIFFVDNFIKVDKGDIELIFNIINVAEKLNFSLDSIYKIFSITNFQTGKRGFDYYKGIKEFSEKLKNEVFNKKIQLNEAYIFHNSFKNDNYDQFLNLLPLNLTFSEKTTILRYTFEISKMKEISLSDIIKNIDFSSKEKLIESIKLLRFPNYEETKRIFADFLKKLALDKNIEYVDTFESEDYKFFIKFSNKKELLEKIEKTYRLLKKDIDKDDLFIHKNLFK